jgi:hypothetical protein
MAKNRRWALEARVSEHVQTDPFGYNNGPRCTTAADRGSLLHFRRGKGVLLCLELADGEAGLRSVRRRGIFEVPEAFFGAGSSPILEDGLLIVQVGGAAERGVVAFDAATGENRVGKRGRKKSWTE